VLLVTCPLRLLTVIFGLEAFMNVDHNKALSHFLEQLVKGRPLTKAGLDVVRQMELNKQRFYEQRKRMEGNINGGARLTKHRISL